jgi:hypothetical protein
MTRHGGQAADNTDESNDESRMSNDEQGAAVSSPPSLGLRRCGISDSTTDDADSGERD